MKLSDVIMTAVNGDNGDRTGLVLDTEAITVAARARRDATTDNAGIRASRSLYNAIRTANPNATKAELTRAMEIVA